MHPITLSVAVRRRHHIHARALRDHGPPTEAHPSLASKELCGMALMPEAVAPALGVANGFRSSTKSAFRAAFGPALAGLLGGAIR